MTMEQFSTAFINVMIITIALILLGYLMHLLSGGIAKLLATMIGSKAAIFVVNRVTFIGVIHHELSHALLAFISGAKIYEISLFKPNGKELGHVRLAYRGNVIIKAIQACLSAYAPVICGTFTSMILIHILLEQNLPVWGQGILIFLLLSIILHEDLSMADIRNGLRGLPIVMFLLFFVFLLSGFDIREKIVFFKELSFACYRWNLPFVI